MRARTRDAVEMHDCRTRCRPIDVAETSPTAVANLGSGVCAIKPAVSSNYAVRSQALATLRSHVPPLHV